MIAEYNQGKEFSINGFLRIRDDDVLFRQDRLGAGLKKVEGPAPQIAIVRLTVAQDPLAKSDLRHSERDRRQNARDLRHLDKTPAPKCWGPAPLLTVTSISWETCTANNHCTLNSGAGSTHDWLLTLSKTVSRRPFLTRPT